MSRAARLLPPPERRTARPSSTTPSGIRWSTASEYFTELDALLRDLGAGDAVLIASLSVDPAIDLHGRRRGRPRLPPARRAAGRARPRAAPWCGSWSPAGCWPRRCPCRRSATSAPTSTAPGACARGDRPAPRTPPLAEHVLVDFAGSVLGSNHQKVVVVSKGGALTAFVGGIDLEDNRYDTAPHDRLRHDGARWGWHDMVVRLRGPATERVWKILGARWAEARSLPRKRYLRDPLHLSPLNPGRFAAAPPDPQPQEPVPAAGTSVRVLRSLSPRKFESLLPWRRIDMAAAPRHRAPGDLRDDHEGHRRRAALRLHRGPVPRRGARRAQGVRALPRTCARLPPVASRSSSSARACATPTTRASTSGASTEPSTRTCAPRSSSGSTASAPRQRRRLPDRARHGARQAGADRRRVRLHRLGQHVQPVDGRHRQRAQRRRADEHLARARPARARVGRAPAHAPHR